MKRLISLIVFLLMVVILIGCFATMTTEQRKETYDLRKSVGNSPFVGDTSPGVRDLAWYQMHGY
jgi:hypothetical protein